MRKLVVTALAAIMLLLFVAPSIAAPGGNGKGKGGADSSTSHLVVPDAVYGSTVTASANPGGEDVYVLVKCWLLDGTFVFGYHYPVVDGQAAIGPLAASTWPNAPAHCTAEEGYYTRNGFGKWEVLATDEFEVAAA